MKRPIGVTILAISLFLGIPYLLFLALVLVGSTFSFGALVFVVTFLSYFVNWLSRALVLFFVQFQSGANAAAFVGFHCFVILLYLIIGAGLLRLQNWARVVVIVLSIVNLVVSIGGYFGPRMILFRQMSISMGIELLVVIYLFQPRVKEAFGAPKF